MTGMRIPTHACLSGCSSGSWNTILPLVFDVVFPTSSRSFSYRFAICEFIRSIFAGDLQFVDLPVHDQRPKPGTERRSFGASPHHLFAALGARALPESTGGHVANLSAEAWSFFGVQVGPMGPWGKPKIQWFITICLTAKN